MINRTKISRIYFFFALSFYSLFDFAQLMPVNTGNTAYIDYISVIKKNILIGGSPNYLVSSKDECNNLLPLTLPGSSGDIIRVHRPDTGNLFLLSYNASNSTLFNSGDGGNNWVQKASIGGSFSREFGFFDSLDGFMSDGQYLSKSINGGATWMNVSSPFSIGLTALKIYGDSLICLGGTEVIGAGIVLSKDRGQTWSAEFPTAANPSDFFFLNKDTIFCVSSYSSLYSVEFAKTTNGGNTWQNTFIPLYAPVGVYFKDKNNGYVVGADKDGKGVVIRTRDLGTTWETFNTGLNSKLTRMDALNDSIAILVGSNGMLLKWNYKNSVFTGLQDNPFTNPVFKIYPNPAKDKIRFDFNDRITQVKNVSIINALGQIIFMKNNLDLKEEIDLSFLEKGIYYLRIESDEEFGIYKIIKE